MINRVIVLNNPLKYTDPSGHGWFKKLRRAFRRVFKQARRVVRAVKKVYNKPVFRIAAAVATAYVTGGASFAQLGREGLIAYGGAAISGGSAGYLTYASSGGSGGGGSGGSREEHYKASELGYGTDNKLPRTFSRLMQRDDFGDFVDFGYTPLHNLRTSGNRDWRNSKTGEQYIFDMFGDLVVTPLNRGTFDKVSPKQSYLGHFNADVLPYLKWGNAADDPSSRQKRLLAFFKTVDYGIGWNNLDPGLRSKRTQSWIDSVTP